MGFTSHTFFCTRKHFYVGDFKSILKWSSFHWELKVLERIFYGWIFWETLLMFGQKIENFRRIPLKTMLQVSENLLKSRSLSWPSWKVSRWQWDSSKAPSKGKQWKTNTSEKCENSINTSYKRSLNRFKCTIKVSHFVREENQEVSSLYKSH